MRHDGIFRPEFKRTEEGEGVQPEGPDLGGCEGLVGAGLRREELPGRDLVAQGRYEVGDGGHGFSSSGWRANGASRRVRNFWNGGDGLVASVWSSRLADDG